MGAFGGAFRLKFGIFSAIALCAGPSDAFARDIYFMANAISNITYEGATDQIITSTGTQTGCSYAGTALTCTLPSLKCRVMIVNPNASSVNVTVSLNHNLLTPDISSNIGATQNPFATTTGTDLAYSASVDVAAAGWVGTTGTMGALTADNDGVVQLTANQYYIFERVINRSYNAVTTGVSPFPATLGSYSQWPYGKWYSACSGMVRVTDVVTSSPGFILASGSLDHYVSSYQNQDLYYGGFNDVSSNLKVAVAAADAQGQSAAYAFINWAGRSGNVYGVGRAACRGYANAYCGGVVSTYNGRSALGAGNGTTSRVSPLQIGKVPIVINGGMPF